MKNKTPLDKRGKIKFPRKLPTVKMTDIDMEAFREADKKIMREVFNKYGKQI